MKKMILKQVCFSLILSSLLFSCGSSTRKYLLYQKTEGTPKHPRALAVNSSGLMVVGGQSGAFEIFQDLVSVKKSSIDDMEDLRDAEILSDGSVVFMNSGVKAEIWRYFPKNDSISRAFKRDSVFLDGISFWNITNGIGFGDPVRGKLTIIRTSDSSKTWLPLDYNLIPKAIDAEAGFAASGTGIATYGDETVFIGTGGGLTANLYVSNDQGINWEVKETPMKSGGAYGIYAMYFWSATEGIIIGGSYSEPEYKDSICYRTQDAGDSWTKTAEGLGGYCSGINGNKDGTLVIATGRTGTFFTKDKGLTWDQFSDDKFYSVQLTEDKVYFSGKNGAIKVFDIQAFE
jgi:photosystem II stability/assembly factor-like uncharacterized protein